jgi:tetratricopeptide (TPR) repeat protein
VVVAGVVVLVLAGRLAWRRERPAVWLRSVGLTLLTAALVGGWHYGRVWARFGTPLVNNFDAASGFRFWQDPGYVTVGHLTGFGRSLAEPFYSAFDGLPDGLYSTLWGDGLCGGSATWDGRPPWNYDLMAAGYLLALVPCLAIGVGLVAAVVGLVRRPRAEWFLLLGVCAGLAAAAVLQFLRYPYHSFAKAIYLLSGAVPLCALAGLGLDVLARLGRAPAAALVILMGTWAGTAYFSFWVQPNGAVAANWAGLRLLERQRPAEAEARFRQAMRADPHAAAPRLNESGMYVRAGLLDWARELTEQVLADDPDNADARVARAVALHVTGQVEAALAELQRASAAAPDHPMAYSIRGGILLGQGRNEEAIAAYRQALRVGPSSPAEHANLGLLLARAGQVEEALARYRRALALRPGYAAWQADLAWLLATAADPKVRDPAEALRLAEAACQRGGDAHSLGALAAAQAAGGNYAAARDTARRAARAALDAKDKELAARVGEQVRSYEREQPFLGRAPQRNRAYPPIPARAVDE